MRSDWTEGELTNEGFGPLVDGEGSLGVRDLSITATAWVQFGPDGFDLFLVDDFGVNGIPMVNHPLVGFQKGDGAILKRIFGKEEPSVTTKQRWSHN